MGFLAGDAVTTGGTNIAIGYDSGHTLITGSYNCYIGNESVGASASDRQYEIVLGTTNSSLVGKGNSTAFIAPGATGNVYNGANSTTWAQISDERIKKNIEDNTTGLNAINQIRVRNFEYRTLDEITDFDEPRAAVVEKEGIQLGVIAQEIETILPDMVTTESTGVKTVDADNMTWYLVNAVKELSTQVDELKAEIQTLKGE